MAIYYALVRHNAFIVSQHSGQVELYINEIEAENAASIQDEILPVRINRVLNQAVVRKHTEALIDVIDLCQNDPMYAEALMPQLKKVHQQLMGDDHAEHD